MTAPAHLTPTPGLSAAPDAQPGAADGYAGLTVVRAPRPATQREGIPQETGDWALWGLGAEFVAFQVVDCDLAWFLGLHLVVLAVAILVSLAKREAERRIPARHLPWAQS